MPMRNPAPTLRLPEGRAVYLLALALLTLVLAACAVAAPVQDTPSTAGGEVVAFVEVNVVPMDRERVLERQTVIVRDGRIAEIGPAASIRVPEGGRALMGVAST